MIVLLVNCNYCIIIHIIGFIVLLYYRVPPDHDMAWRHVTDHTSHRGVKHTSTYRIHVYVCVYIYIYIVEKASCGYLLF